MKKIVSLLLTLLFVFNLSNTFAFASGSDTSDSVAAAVDTSLFEALGIEINTSSYEHLTRSEFVYILVQSVGCTAGNADELPFKDVKTDAYYAGALRYALDTGIISNSTHFYPDAPVRFNEACKMAVSALGLDYYAIARGGYPTGYIIAADASRLLMGVSSGEHLSYTDAFAILDNFLHAQVHSESGYYVDDETFAVYEKGNTVLATYHDIEVIEGAVITATPYTGLYESEGACGISEIEINDTIFKYYGESVGLIGKMADVYYKKGSHTGEVIFIRPDDSKTITISTRDIHEVTDSTVSYMVGDSEKRINLILSPSFIYNNCARGGYSASDIMSVDGTVSFIDSDGDNKYDVVYIMECTITVAQDIDIYSGYIMGKDGTRIDLGSKDVIFSITKNGTPIDIVDLQIGDVLQIYRSSDNKVISVAVSQMGDITGTVTEIDTTGRKIYIDSVAYPYTAAFATDDLRYCKLSSKVTLALTDSGIVAACIKSESIVLFGYYIAVKQSEGLDNTVSVKLLSDNGEVGIYTLADSVIYNGTSTSKADVYKFLNVKKEQLIRYAANTDNVIRMIDTQDSVGIISDSLSDEDNLTLYQYPSDVYSTIHYITKTAFFHPYFRISSDTTVFRIIDDDTLDESKRYATANASYFQTNKAQKPDNLIAYNVKESGDAGAVVVKTTAAGTDISDESPGGLIYSVNPAIDSQGEKALAVVIYKADTFSRYYIEDESVLSAMSEGASFSNPVLRKGDYVRFTVGLHDDITAIHRDFRYDPDPEKCVIDILSDEKLNHLHYMYYYGTPYMRDGDIVSILPEKVPEAFGNRDDALNDASLRYRLPLTSAITVYDTASDTVYEGSLVDIITYTESPVDCGKILINTDSGNVLDVVYYK